MKKEQIVPIIIVAAVLLVAVVAVIYFVANPTAWQAITVELGLADAVTDGISASGFFPSSACPVQIIASASW